MKTRIPFMAAVAALLLPLAVPANVLESLASNPDDVMLRKPARTEARRSNSEAVAKKTAEEATAKKAVEEAAAKKAAEEAAAKKAAAEAEAQKAAELKRLREEVAAAQAAREQAEAARKAAEAKAAAEKAAAEKAQAEKAAAEKAAEEKLAAERAAAKKLAEEKAAAEKRAAYLANPDPDERPAAPKRKLQASGEQKDVTEALPATGKPAEAKKDKEKKKLTGRSALITSDRTDYDRKEGVILFDRNVYVDDEQYQMHADRLFVFLDGTNDLKRLVAIGNISITNDTKAAGCLRAVYTKSESRIVLYGDGTHPAWLRDAGGKKGDASEIRGKRITYWFDSETATVEGAVLEVPGIKGGTKDLFGGAAGKSEKKSEKVE